MPRSNTSYVALPAEKKLVKFVSLKDLMPAKKSFCCCSCFFKKAEPTLQSPQAVGPINQIIDESKLVASALR